MLRRPGAPKPLTSSQKIVRSKSFAKAVRTVINRHDPVGLIAKGAPVDEYDYQQAAIMRKIPACKSIERLTWMLHEEFSHWFHRENVGSREKYRQPASDLFQLYQEFRKTHKAADALAAEEAVEEAPPRPEELPVLDEREAEVLAVEAEPEPEPEAEA